VGASDIKKTEQDLGRWISIIHRLGQVHLGIALADQDIGPGQAAFLAELARSDGPTQEELSSLLRIDKGNTTRRLCALERSGFVERRPDPADRRLRRVFLTESGQNATAQLVAAQGTWEGTLLRGLSPREQALLPKLLQRMAINAERLLGEAGSQARHRRKKSPEG